MRQDISITENAPNEFDGPEPLICLPTHTI
jgi:hypothetical protein